MQHPNAGWIIQQVRNQCLNPALLFQIIILESRSNLWGFIYSQSGLYSNKCSPSHILCCNQTLVNNSTSPRYLKNIQYLANTWSQIVGWILVLYSTQPRVEYLYFGRLWQLLVELSQFKPKYDSALTRLRLQSFGIYLDDEPRVGTPLCRNLVGIGDHLKIV